MAKKNANGEGSIYRANGRWVGVVSLGYQGGKRRRRAVCGKTHEEVAKQVRKILSAKNRGQVVPTGTQTLGQFLAWWLEDDKRPSVRPLTYEGYEQKLRLHIVPELGNVRLDRLTPQRVQTFLNQKLQEGLAPATVKSVRVLLLEALNKAHELDEVSRNVVLLTKAPHQS